MFSWTSALAEQTVTAQWTAEDVDMLAKLIYTEARGVPSRMEQAAVVWCALNRVDSDRWPDTIKDNITRPNQFAWNPDAPLLTEYQILAENVLWRWSHEKQGIESGRVLPKEYCFFAGRDGRNWFRDGKGNRWDWRLESPYEN